MPRLYVNPTLEKQVRQYCELNDIEDVNAFANRCLSQGLNIIKFGMSPKDNVERENNGIKDIVKNGKKKSKDIVGCKEGKQAEVKEERVEEPKEEEVKPTEKRTEQVTTRKIRVIKKS